MAAVGHVRFLRKAHFNHSTCCGAPFSKHSKFGEDILIGIRDMPAKQIRKSAPWQRNSTSSSNFDACRPSSVSSCKISTKSDNQQPSYSDLALWGPLCAKGTQSWGDPLLHGLYREVCPPSFLYKFFRILKKSSSLKWRRSEQEWCRNSGQNFGLFAPV